MSISVNFTNTTLKSINSNPAKKEIYTDTKESGLQLFVHKRGKKTFVLRKRFGDKNTFYIGKFPDLSVDDARKIALNYKNKIAYGIDPVLENKERESDSITFGEMFENYIEKHAKIHTKTWKDISRDIPLFFSNIFGKKANLITKDELVRMRDSAALKRGQYYTNRAYSLLNSIFNKNIEWGWNHLNPCIGIKKFKEVSRDRFMQPEEMPRFFKALESEENQTNKDCIYMLLSTGARKSNVFAMKWDEVSLISRQWRIPDTKNGEPVVIPLIEQAIKILERRKRANTQNSPFVFAGKGKTGHIADIKKAWYRILKRADIQNLRIHDIRRSVGSWMAITGSTTAIIGKQLGHKSKAATAIYERLNIDPVREGLEKATNKIMEFSKL